jgi:hypothetical protein
MLLNGWKVVLGVLLWAASLARGHAMQDTTTKLIVSLENPMPMGRHLNNGSRDSLQFEKCLSLPRESGEIDTFVVFHLCLDDSQSCTQKYVDLDGCLELTVSDLYSKFDSYCSNCESSCEQESSEIKIVHSLILTKGPELHPT